MENPTPEQLKAEKAERDSVLAELLISERKNKELTADNNRLEKSVSDLTEKEAILSQKVEERKKLIIDIGQHQKNIVGLKNVEHELRSSILRAETDIGLQTWVGQRDKILKTISELKTEEERLTTKNTELGLSNSDLELRISKSTGRLEEMEKAEETKGQSIKLELAILVTAKSKLEGEVLKEKTEVESLGSKKAMLLEAITTLTQIYDKVFENVHEMEGIVGSVKEVSDKNISDLRGLFAEMGSQIKDVIEKGKESSDSANVILEKLPRWIFELQRPVSIKRVRPERLVNRVLPDETKKDE